MGLGRNAAQISLQSSGHGVNGGSKGDEDDRVLKHGCVVLKGETRLSGMRAGESCTENEQERGCEGWLGPRQCGNFRLLWSLSLGKF